MHFCDDTAILEAVDDDCQPTPAGGTSQRMLITNLMNQAMPLVRYELEDRVTVSAPAVPCACGSYFQKINRVVGRTEEVFVYDAVTINPFAFQTLLGHESKIVEYQVRQTPNGAHVELVAVDAVDVNSLRDALTRMLISQGLSNPKVSLLRVSSLERTALGKTRRFIPILHCL